MSEVHKAAKAPRNTRKRERTRTRLINGAREVIGRTGVAGASIADFTEAADIGLGTFYNYFDSKEALVTAAAQQTARELSEVIRSHAAGVDDPAVALAETVSLLLRWFEDDPNRANFVVQVATTTEFLRQTVGLALGEVLFRGATTGRFSVDPILAAITVGGAILAVYDTRAKGLISVEQAETGMVEHALRIAGIATKEAAEIAAASVPG